MHKAAFLTGYLIGFVQTVLFSILSFILVYNGLTRPILLSLFVTFVILSHFAMSKYFKIYENIDNELARAKIFEPIPKTSIKDKFYQIYSILSIIIAGLVCKTKSYFKR